MIPTKPLEQLKFIHNPKVITQLTKVFKDLGLSNKQIIEAIKSTQKDILKEVMIEKVNQLSAEMIHKIQTI